MSRQAGGCKQVVQPSSWLHLCCWLPQSKRTEHPGRCDKNASWAKIWLATSKYALWFKAGESQIFLRLLTPRCKSSLIWFKRRPTKCYNYGLAPTPQLILLPPSSQPIGPKLCHLLCVFVVVPVTVVWYTTSWLGLFLYWSVRLNCVTILFFFIVEFLTCMDAFSHSSVCLWSCLAVL